MSNIDVSTRHPTLPRVAQTYPAARIIASCIEPEMPTQAPWHSKWPSALVAAIAHLPALALGFFLLTVGLPIWAAVSAAGLGAALLAWHWALPRWWQIINLGFVPLLWLAMLAELPQQGYLFAFALLAMTSWGAIRTRVPLYLSSQQATEMLAQYIPANALFMDLGCGLGGPLQQLAKRRPDIRLQGIEAAPLNWLISRLRLSRRARIQFGSLWDAPLSECDVVYAYLSPAPMAQLWQKAKAEMKPGSLFISNTFAVPGVPPHETVELHDLSHARLLIWRL